MVHSLTPWYTITENVTWSGFRRIQRAARTIQVSKTGATKTYGPDTLHVDLTKKLTRGGASSVRDG